VRGKEVASTGHAACVGCHAEDFGIQKPKICLACHTSIEPWRHLLLDRLPPPATEFGATLQHDRHPQPCTDCHKLDTTGHELRTPRGHAACNACHLASGGPAPQLGQCEGCHTRGMQSMRDIVRAGAAWSVRRQFHHAPHAKAACTDCHTDLSAASVADLATPAKRTCAGCHDGRASFKLTGTTCTRCHAGAK
jgi:predicted CXXCH cytochrome family protein